MAHKATSLLPFVTAEALDRFWSKVYCSPSGHWIWMGKLASNGYPIFSVGYRRTGAHRLSVELDRGPIADGLVVDHLCRIKRCVNPVHLQSVTQQVNVSRGVHHAAVAARTGRCHAGHDLNDVSNLWVGPTGERKCRACSTAKRRQRWEKYKADNSIQSRSKGICTTEGCDVEHYAKGFCKRHYMQARVGRPLT